MDFSLTEEQTAIFDMAKSVAQSEIAPYAAEWDKAGEIPRALWPKLAELGFGGLYVREDSGGTGLSRLESTLVFEALAIGCASVSAFLSIHNMGAWMLDQWGSDELRDRLLNQAIAMEKVISYCLTEPGCGSDAAALKTRAEKIDTGYALTGTKAFISGGGYSDAYIVMARTGGDGPKGISAIMVEDGTPGLSFGGLEEKMGWRNQPTRQVQLDGVTVPASHLMGEEGAGFTYAMKGLNGGRLNISACSLGGAQAALDRSLTYMKERRAFGRSLDQFQALQFRLADMQIELSAARTFLHQAAWKLDQGTVDAPIACAMAKTFVTEVSSRVANGCLQLHGGYGYLEDYGIEKILRDLRVHEILEGTNEIMRMIVARDLTSG
jgi:alkylation response protein AidB-like acyl-CoA dehydrogenase